MFRRLPPATRFGPFLADNWRLHVGESRVDASTRLLEQVVLISQLAAIDARPVANDIDR